MKLDPEGVEKAARALIETEPAQVEILEASRPVRDWWNRRMTAALTAYFSHLRESGKMFDAKMEFGGARFHTASKDAVVIKTEADQ